MVEKRRLQVREILKLFDSNGADVGVSKNVLHVLTTTPNRRILEKNYDSLNFFKSRKNATFRSKSWF